jgi:hypothetical protein
LDSRFSLGSTRSEYPTRAFHQPDSVLGGYGEAVTAATFDISASRNLGKRLLLKATGNVSLNAFRDFIIIAYKNLPVNHDQYRQEYRLDAQYTMSPRFNSGVALDVTRNVLVNIPAKSTGANNEVRNYRADWRWSYRMMPGLTASQSNSIEAEYKHYNFKPPGNDQASLGYSSSTTLNAVLSPRFTMDIRHNLQHQPKGTYTLFPDGLYYMSRTEVSDNYTLSARLSYQPFPALSLNLQPDYQASENQAAQSGVLAPTRVSRGLNFSGGASLNVPVGRKARLTGDVSCTYRANRTLEYGSSGLTGSQSRPEPPFWNGSLQLSWQL